MIAHLDEVFYSLFRKRLWSITKRNQTILPLSIFVYNLLIYIPYLITGTDLLKQLKFYISSREQDQNSSDFANIDQRTRPPPMPCWFIWWYDGNRWMSISSFHYRFSQKALQVLADIVCIHISPVQSSCHTHICRCHTVRWI